MSQHLDELQEFHWMMDMLQTVDVQERKKLPKRKQND
jgi:hypothetical protein